MTFQQKESATALVELQKKFDAIKNQVCCCGNGIELRESPFGGLGVFATKNFSKGDAVTLYGGQLIGIDEAKKRLDANKESHIRRHFARIYCFDGLYMPDGTLVTEPLKQLAGLPIGAFCNDGGKEHNNAHFNYADSSENERRYIEFENGALYRPLPDQRLTFVEALRDISAGEEILCSYGNDYWMRSKEKQITKTKAKNNVDDVKQKEKKRKIDTVAKVEPSTMEKNQILFAPSYEDLMAVDTICIAWSNDTVYFCRKSCRAWSKVVVLGGKNCLIQYVAVDALPEPNKEKEIPNFCLAEFKVLCESSFGTTLGQDGSAKDCAENFSKRMDVFLAEK